MLADKAMLTPEVLATARGRAASLYLLQGDAATAQTHLSEAQSLCAARCTQAAALAVLAARIALANKDAVGALKLATDALTLPAMAASTTPLLQPQASAERANALRVQAQAHAALKAAQASATAADGALQLDRSLGLADRVAMDLQLLADAHRALGNAEKASEYRQLAERSAAANAALTSGAQSD